MSTMNNTAITKLKTEILRLFESDEMRHCINTEYDSLHILTKADIIKGARADIRKKLKLLKCLYETDDKSDSRSSKQLLSDISGFECAIGHMCGISGDIYIVGEYGFDYDINDEKLYGFHPYTCFQDALQYIKNEWEDAKETYNGGFLPVFWYTVGKYSPDGDDLMHEQMCWFITAEGTVTGFGTAGRMIDINIPHPFSEGDIVVMDSTPSFPERLGLIIETGPNFNDCCFPQALFLSKDGKFCTGAVKHASVFRDHSHFPQFSPMYRLKTYKGELPGDIRIFKKISYALKNQGNPGAYPSLGNILWDNIYKTDNVAYGVSESELDGILERSLNEWHLRGYSG